MRWFLLSDSPQDDAARRWFRSTSRRPPAAAIENLQSPDGYWIYWARAVPAGFVFCFNAAISVFAAGPEECGFCPVISRPSLTT
jgi:hypothetical protein